MRNFQFWRGLLIVACLSLVTTLAACGDTITVTTASATGTPANGATPGTTPAATATATPATCATLLPGAGPATGGSGFSDIPFPTNSVSTAQTGFSSGTGQYTISLFQACSPNTSAAAVKSYYATQLIAGGWAQDPTLPFNGAYEQPCGDPYCWERGTNPIARRLIGLEQVTDKGNSLVTYQWRVFTPPPAGNCNPADMTGGVSSGNGGPNDGFQYPPVTTYNDLGGAAGTHADIMCSAGDASSIAAFMKTAIGNNSGWQVLSYSSTSVHAQKPTSPPSGFCYTLDVNTGTHGSYIGEWNLYNHIPAASCV